MIYLNLSHLFNLDIDSIPMQWRKEHYKSNGVDNLPQSLRSIEFDMYSHDASTNISGFSSLTSTNDSSQVFNLIFK